MVTAAHSNNVARQAEGRAPAVLQVLPALGAGGAERGALEIAEALADAGWRAVVASSGGPLQHQIERTGATHVTLPLHAKNPFVIRRNIERLMAVIHSHDIDIVHARSRAPAWSARAAARRTARPFVTTFHGTYNASNPLKRRYNAIMTSGDKVIAISAFIGRHIRDKYGIDDERLVVIPRGVDLNRFDPERVSAERMIRLVNAWRLPVDLPVVMLPGRLTRWKGQLDLLDALARLGRDDFRCLLVGDAQGRERYRGEIERRIAKNGLDQLVAIIGHCDDMPAAYKLADVVVSASTDAEAFGRVTAEAQAMGRPVVATDHGGSRETVLAGETGLLVPPGDAQAMAEAIAACLDLGAEDRKALAHAARAHIAANFTIERMQSETLAVYAGLAPKRAPAKADKSS